MIELGDDCAAQRREPMLRQRYLERGLVQRLHRFVSVILSEGWFSGCTASFFSVHCGLKSCVGAVLDRAAAIPPTASGSLDDLPALAQQWRRAAAVVGGHTMPALARLRHRRVLGRRAKVSAWWLRPAATSRVAAVAVAVTFPLAFATISATATTDAAAAVGVSVGADITHEHREESIRVRVVGIMGADWTIEHCSVRAARCVCVSE